MELEFFAVSECYNLILYQHQYKIIAKDEGLSNILASVDENGHVWSLDTEESEEKYAVYIASSPEVFRKEIELFHEFCESRPLNETEEALKQSADEFRRQILYLDENAFSDSENYWSVVAEELESGVI